MGRIRAHLDLKTRKLERHLDPKAFCYELSETNRTFEGRTIDSTTQTSEWSCQRVKAEGRHHKSDLKSGRRWERKTRDPLPISNAITTFFVKTSFSWDGRGQLVLRSAAKTSPSVREAGRF